jgi:DNA-binding phage protein
MRKKANTLQISASECYVTTNGIGTDDYVSQLVQYLKNPAESAAYLEAALQEGDRETLLLAMRHVAAARGGMAAIAQKTGLSRESL